MTRESEDLEATGKDRETFKATKERSDAIWKDLDSHPERYRMLTGDRPTGPLHIGHYFGTLKNRVHLQDIGLETFIVIADYQVLTDRELADGIHENTREVILDYLASGLDPFGKKTTIFCHSHVPELNQLLLPFLTLVSVSELERNPTVKEEAQAANLKVMNACMLTYPVHQAADILFCKGNLVPVGKDQLPHLEISRKIARRFNQRFSPDEPIFPMPSALLSEASHILGLDGDQKMSKSRGNAIFLRMTAKETEKLIKKAKTDADRNITYDPTGRPEVSNLLSILALTTDRSAEEWAAEIGDGGAGTLKRELALAVNEYFAPMRRRREELAKDPELVSKVLTLGNERARAEARTTLDEVRSAMNMDYGLQD
jgi:tryptophanyl-tRNA synthetase